ncbi:MAG TPA: hypothetical protein VLG47_01250 [Candidatus Saccharimonadales bacterium]|nr:hypothetical protein [Candidatus Saccharimonadales bacterium]
MTPTQAKEMLDKIVGQIFGYKNPLSLDTFMQKFAFDVRLPQAVTDAVDGKETWASSTNPTRFVRLSNARNYEIAGAGPKTDYMRPKRQLNDINDVLTAWNEINYTTTERNKDSLNVGESDNVMFSENVFRSQDIRKCKNILFSDGLANCEFVVAGQRSASSTFCVRLDDSIECSNCFNVAWSAKLNNCFFMHDCADMQDSMFCTNNKGKQYCVANMQYDADEYHKIKDLVMRWILTN